MRDDDAREVSIGERQRPTSVEEGAAEWNTSYAFDRCNDPIRMCNGLNETRGRSGLAKDFLCKRNQSFH